MHPDPAEIGHLYRPDVGLCGSVTAGLEDLQLSVIPKLERRGELLDRRRQEVRVMHEGFLGRRQDAFAPIQGASPLRVISLARTLAKLVGPETTLVVDAATSNDVLVEYVPRFNEKNHHAQGTGGNLGWGMGAAVGLKMGDPNRRVCCVVGDGVFMFGMPALHVAAKNKVPVTFVVVNNSSYAAVKSGLLRFKGRAAEKGVFPGSDISGPDYAKIAEGFGVRAFKVSSEQDYLFLSSAMAQDEEPFLIEVLTDPLDVGRIER